MRFQRVVDCLLSEFHESEKFIDQNVFAERASPPTISPIQNREILVTRNPKFSEPAFSQSGSFKDNIDQLQCNSIPNNSQKEASESVLQVFSINHQYESTIACYRLSRVVLRLLQSKQQIQN